MMKLKKTWFIMVGIFIFSVLGGMTLLQKEASAAGDYTIWAELSTLTYEQKNFDIPLDASQLLVFASDSEGNMLADEDIAITKIQKKQVYIDRTVGQYGTKSYIDSEDITSDYQDATEIGDANGIYTITYAVNGTSPSVTVTVQAGDFSAPEIYKDREGNNATVDARTGVKSATEIAYGTTGIAGYMKANDWSEVNFSSFDVWENGTKKVTGQVEGAISVAKEGIYKVHATATDEFGNVTKYPVFLQDQYLAIEDFEERAAGSPTTWASQDTLLVQHYDSLQITGDEDNKQLTIKSSSTQWPFANILEGVRYDGFGTNYGLGLFELPLSTEHEYKATFDVTIKANYNGTAEGEQVYIGYPMTNNSYNEKYWTKVTLDANGTYIGKVTIPQVQIDSLGAVGDEPYYSSATTMIWFMFKDETGTNAEVTIDNMQLIPLVSEKNAIISSVETATKTVNDGDVISLLPESYGLKAADFRGLELASISLEVKKGDPKSAVSVEIEEGVTELIAEQGDYYQLIYTLTDYYGNTKVETITVRAGEREFNAPIITADNAISLAKGTEVSFGNTPNKYFTVEEESSYTLKYTVEKNGVVEQTDVETYSFTFADTDTYKVTITATDQWGASASKTLVFNYAGAYMIDFEDRAVGSVTDWTAGKTLYVHSTGTSQIVEDDNQNKQLKIEQPLGAGWNHAAQGMSGTVCAGFRVVTGLGLYDLPLDNTIKYKAVCDVTMNVAYAEAKSGHIAYIGYPHAQNNASSSYWTKITLNEDGTYQGLVELPWIQGNDEIASNSTQIWVLFDVAPGDTTTATQATVSIDNLRLIPVSDAEQTNEQILETGATVTFDKQGTVAGINGNGYESFTYTVEKNNEIVATDVESYTIESISATDYYEVWVIAKDAYGNSESKYMLFVGESVNINTFSNLSTDKLTWGNGFVFSYSGQSLTKEVYTDASGNKKLRFTISETEKLQSALTMYLTSSYFNFGMPFNTTLTDTQYDTYLDLTVKVKLKEGTAVPRMRMAGVIFNLTEASDGWYTYSGTLKNYDYKLHIDGTFAAFQTDVAVLDDGVVTDMIVEIDNMRWVDLR